MREDEWRDPSAQKHLTKETKLPPFETLFESCESGYKDGRITTPLPQTDVDFIISNWNLAICISWTLMSNPCANTGSCVTVFVHNAQMVTYELLYPYIYTDAYPIRFCIQFTRVNHAGGRVCPEGSLHRVQISRLSLGDLFFPRREIVFVPPHQNTCIT